MHVPKRKPGLRIGTYIKHIPNGIMYIKEYAFTLNPENLKFLEIRHQTGSRANGKNTKSTVTNKIKNKKWAAEPTHPLRVFHEAGYEVDLV
jgi:hypothetical protein